jgi:hypothetical protein
VREQEQIPRGGGRRGGTDEESAGKEGRSPPANLPAPTATSPIYHHHHSQFTFDGNIDHEKEAALEKQRRQQIQREDLEKQIRDKEARKREAKQKQQRDELEEERFYRRQNGQAPLATPPEFSNPRQQRPPSARGLKSGTLQDAVHVPGLAADPLPVHVPGLEPSPKKRAGPAAQMLAKGVWEGNVFDKSPEQEAADAEERQKVSKRDLEAQMSEQKARKAAEK